MQATCLVMTRRVQNQTRRVTDGGGDGDSDTPTGDITITGRAVTDGVINSVGGSATGYGVYANGDTVTMTAVPEQGYSFVKWAETVNGEAVSTSSTYTFTASEDKTLYAHFETDSEGTTITETVSDVSFESHEAGRKTYTLQHTPVPGTSVIISCTVGLTDWTWAFTANTREIVVPLSGYDIWYYKSSTQVIEVNGYESSRGSLTLNSVTYTYE